MPCSVAGSKTLQEGYGMSSLGILVYLPCILNWRVSEASKTLSGKMEDMLHMYIYIYMLCEISF